MSEGDEHLLADYQRRTRELAALYETAGDLSALRDVDQVLGAIVHRGRQLLATDVAYLMLLDDERQEAYMRVTEGTLTPEFLSIRLAFGEGLGGLVAGTGMPQWTSDYFGDDRFAPSIDWIIRAEQLTAILGVPLKIGERVTGVLFASDRKGRRFTHSEVALLSSLASHAAIALENASLFEESQRALGSLREANERIAEHNAMLERAADLHETLTSLVLTGASLASLADAVADALGGRVLVVAADGTPLTPRFDLPDAALPLPEDADAAASVEVTGPDGLTYRIAPAQAGARRLGHLIYAGAPLAATDVRSLERAALVTALMLLDLRAHEEARIRALGETFTALTAGNDVDEARVRDRAQAAGVTLPEAPYVVLAALPSRDDGDTGSLGRAASRLALAERGLAGTHAGHAALVLHGPDAAALAHDVAERLGATEGTPVTVGGVGPAASLSEAAASLSRALTCAKVLATVGQVGTGATPEQLGVYTLLFSDAGRDRIEGFVAEAIGPLQAYDAARDGALVPTLEAWYDAGGQTGQVAEALFVHVNTLYQRLERVDRLLGSGWRRGEQSLQVHLALRLARLLRQM